MIWPTCCGPLTVTVCAVEIAESKIALAPTASGTIPVQFAASDQFPDALTFHVPTAGGEASVSMRLANAMNGSAPISVVLDMETTVVPLIFKDPVPLLVQRI